VRKVNLRNLPSRSIAIFSSAPPKIRSRAITDSDLSDVAGLLARGFPRRRRQHWLLALERLATHPTISSLPKYGYLLECDNTSVGVILLISTAIQANGAPAVRCNLSSWYVEPAYRAHAALLYSRALRHKDVTYINISAAAHVLPIVEAFGFSRYSNGQFAALAALSPAPIRQPIRVVTSRQHPSVFFEPSEADLLKAHAEYGCISFWCITPERAYPFVCLPRIVKGFLPCAQLIYCRDIEDFVRFARPIGWFLARRGRPFVLIDSNHPIPGLLGKYFDGVSPRYFKGLAQPRIGDLAFTEAALFGL
jgi:hypothetical protein